MVEVHGKCIKLKLANLKKTKKYEINYSLKISKMECEIDQSQVETHVFIPRMDF